MQYRTFADLYALIQALCGVSFAATEKPRIKALVNRRAQKAYRSSNYWPRYLKVGEERTVANGSLIGYTQSGLSSIDTFLRIHKIAPYMTASSQEYDFMVGASGATLIAGTLNPTSAFVTYKEQISTTQLGDGSGEDTNIPYEWFQYLAHGTYADYLRAEGQQEKAAIADQEATELLQDELIRIDEQHTLQIVANRIFTNANNQSRY
jgi:hypothetical protein